MHWIEIYNASDNLLEKIPALAGQSLYDVLHRLGILFPNSCQGLGKCKNCRVTVQTAGSSLKTEVLSCRYFIDSSIKVFLPYLPETHFPEKQSRKSSIKSPFRRINIPLPDTIITGGIVDYLGQNARKKVKNHSFFTHSLSPDFFMKKTLSLQVSKNHFWTADPGKHIVVLCDFGTSTVTCMKIDTDRKTQETFHFANSQSRFGPDIISRIDYITQGQENFKSFTDQNLSFISSLLNTMEISREQVLAFILAGNSVMESLLRGYLPQSLGLYPYILVWSGDEWVFDQKLLWYFFPLVTGFIGGDLIAGLYGIHADKRKDFLFIDIGTNGELALGNEDTILTCSCAAGPALEGGHIEKGGPAVSGAVYRLNSGRFKTIGDANPHSFCGSGIIDFIWAAYRENILGADGSVISSKSNHFTVSDDKIIYTALPELYLRQEEIRHFQTAKAAFWSGIKILLEENTPQGKVPAQIHVGGGFAHSLNIEALEGLHFFPSHVFTRQVLSSPQPVMQGLVRFYQLLNRSPEKTLQKIISRIKPLDLANHPHFEQYFMQGMFLVPENID